MSSTLEVMVPLFMVKTVDLDINNRSKLYFSALMV